MTTYNRKMDDCYCNKIQDILQYRSLELSLLKGQNAPIWRTGNRGVNTFFLFLSRAHQFNTNQTDKLSRRI